MSAKILAIVLVLLPSAALADSQLPWFGSSAIGAVQLPETTGSLGEAHPAPQLKISTNYRCMAKTCPNPADFNKPGHGTAGSPQ